MESTRIAARSCAVRPTPWLLLAVGILGLPGVASAQLDLQSWTLVDPYVRWSKVHPTPTSCRMDETASSSSVGPGWVVSPFVLPSTASFDVSLQQLATSDDDILGLAFCYQSNTQMLLLDWKKSTQSWNWGDPVAINDDIAEAGMKVKKVAGSWTRDGLWGGTDGLGVSTLAGPLTPGWVTNVVYLFHVDITPGHVVIQRDGVQLFDLTDPAVTAGRIAFYAFSQDNVVFSNVYIAPGGPMSYCTAGTTTSGCLPAISATSNPDVAHQTSCVITVADVEGQQNGLLFYGVSGASASPWAPASSSFLCVKTPFERTSVQSSGGTAGQCDGTFTLYWNLWQLGHPGALGQPWTAGANAYVQAWFRDPPAPRTTNLSDALQLSYLP